MKISYRGFKYAVLATLIAGALAVLSTFVTSGNRPPGSVRIGFLNIAASLPLFIAEENGYFLDEGIDVETFAMATSNQLVDGILAGNLDVFVESSAVPVLAAELRLPGAMKIFAVSAITSEAPFDTILVPSDAPLEYLSELEQTSIGVFPGSTATNLLRKFLADSGIDVGSIRFVPIPPQSQLTALLEGSIDALHAYEPTTAIALTSGEARRLHGSVYADMLEPNPQGVAAVSAAFVDEFPETAASAIRALERAMEFMREDDAESRAILARRLGLSDSAAGAMIFLYMVSHEDIPAATLQSYADMLAELDELPGSLDVSEMIFIGD